MTTRTALGALTCLFAAALTGRAQPPALDTDAIAKAWQDRQDKVKTATFEVKRTWVIAKGAQTSYVKINDEHQALAAKLKKEPHTPSKFSGPFPKTDATFTTSEKVLLDGVKLRYDHTAVAIDWKNLDNGHYLYETRTAFDGKVYRDWSGYREGAQGATRAAEFYPDANMLAMTAILHAFRGRTPAYTTLKAHDLVATGRKQVIDGHECIECKLPSSGMTYHAWFSPTQGWCLVRLIGERIDKKYEIAHHVIRQERRYKPDPIAGWVPVSWESTEVGDGRVTFNNRFEVLNYAINTPLEPNAFNIDFEPGLKVLHDVTGGFSGKIQSDGSFLPDNGKPAYYLPGTDESATRFWMRILAYVAGACILLLLCWRGVKRYRQSRSLHVNGSAT